MPVKDTLAITAIGSALSSVSTTTALTVPSAQSVMGVVVIVATSVTTGATLQVEVTSSDTGVWAHTATFDVTASGSYAVPLRGHPATGQHSFGQVRVKCTSRTDGTYTCYLSTLTKTAT